MTQYLQKMFASVNGPRDDIFKNILNSFSYKPLSIFQVGAIEVLSGAFRYGSGWSEFFWSIYIQKYGGKLWICDIDDDHLNNSKQVLDGFNIKKTFECISGENLLRSFMRDDDNNKVSCFDLVYLDGGNEPEETKNQFDMIDLNNTVVLIDDMEIKGDHLVDQYDWHIFNVTGKTQMGLLI